jgi:hypothetical protein
MILSDPFQNNVIIIKYTLMFKSSVRSSIFRNIEAITISSKLYTFRATQRITGASII